MPHLWMGRRWASYQIRDSLVVEEVCTEVQEGVLRLHWGGLWHGGLRWSVAVADGAPIACGGDVPCDA